MSSVIEGWRKAAFAFVSYAAPVDLLILHPAERGGCVNTIVSNTDVLYRLFD